MIPTYDSPITSHQSPITNPSFVLLVGSFFCLFGLTPLNADAVVLRHSLQIGEHHEWRIDTKQTTIPIYAPGRTAASPTEVRMKVDMTRSVFLVDDRGNHICSIQTKTVDAYAYVGANLARVTPPTTPTMLVTIDPDGQVIRTEGVDRSQPLRFSHPYVGMILLPLPDEAVDVGATWNVSVEKTTRGERKNISKLVAFEEINGEQCARITSIMAIPISGMAAPVQAFPNGAQTTVELFGEATTWFSIERGVVVKVSGTADIDMTMTPPNGRRQMYRSRIITELSEKRGTG